ncbi:aldo/keto reductase [Sphingobium sp. SCG-1]|uniref:aldo/keto reductase n=1 Tax=Sphingobium sp. SCG-1 TaxID=2072936 RepID=UPI000CD695E6|nr:aldo/keto reductase [Sphingobium sp. SCG-1]AUW57806.1 aldo/keto reductase [Sphingobium sp. SCG-1]
MQMRQLGANGPQVSAIGLGTMRTSFVPGSGDEVTIATIQAALDAGINLLNTGDFYGMGSNELTIGRAIKGRRDDALVSVKFGPMRTHSGGFIGFDGRPSAVKNFAAYSLTRLGVDVIDIYQPARVDPAVPIEETVGAIADLIKEGKVRYLGLSEASADNIRRAHAVHSVTALEIEYSLATRFIEKTILPTARELGIGVVAYSVVGQGLLVGNIEGVLPPGDPRKIFPRFEDENLVHNLKQVAILKDIASRKGFSPAQIAIAWVLSRGDDIVPLVGMSRPTRVPENLATLDIVLTDTELAELDAAFAPGMIAGDRYPAHARALAPE